MPIAIKAPRHAIKVQGSESTRRIISVSGESVRIPKIPSIQPLSWLFCGSGDCIFENFLTTNAHKCAPSTLIIYPSLWHDNFY